MNRHIRVIKLQLPAGQAKMGGELGAILGQYNLNILKFCNEFNSVSKIYQPGLSIQVDLLVLPGNAFEIKLRGLATKFLLSSYTETNTITLLNIVKVAQIKQKDGDSAPLKSICKNLVSYLQQKQLTITYE